MSTKTKTEKTGLSVAYVGVGGVVIDGVAVIGSGDCVIGRGGDGGGDGVSVSGIAVSFCCCW